MKMRNLLLAAMGSLALVGAVQAQDGMGMQDENFKISREDFIKQAEERFAQMDFNKDGVIDASDRQQMYQRMQGCMEMMGGRGMMWGYPGMMGWGAGRMGPGMMGPGMMGSGTQGK
jgi:hypothetical protein